MGSCLDLTEWVFLGVVIEPVHAPLAYNGSSGQVTSNSIREYIMAEYLDSTSCESCSGTRTLLRRLEVE